MASIAKPTDFVDIDNMEKLLDYVFEGLLEISDVPSEQEYHKLARIMKIMVRFYVRGSEAKKAQRQECLDSLERVSLDEKMCDAQLDALRPFPMNHPKKKAYFDALMSEREHIAQSRAAIEAKLEELTMLFEWSLRVVDAVTWLQDNIEDYCNIVLHLNPQRPVRFPVQEMEEKLLQSHKKALDEITYNLQESQDFFDASLDGRLGQFHQLEKCMIEAQLKALEAFPEDSPRRLQEQQELQADLEYVKGNMNEDPKKFEHRRRMREMHRDFFRVLRWQRRKVKKQLGVTDESDAQEEVEEEEERQREDKARAENGGICPVAPAALGPDGQLPSIKMGSCPIGADK